MRALVSFTAGLLLLIGFVVILVVVVLPYLASRGDLDAFVEKVLRASFNREVQIGSLETDPLSRFNITHISSLKLESADSSYSEFSCERVSVLYSPIDLVFGHVEELSLVRPRIAINFDKELEDVIATWPSEPRSLDQLRDPRSGALPAELSLKEKKVLGGLIAAENKDRKNLYKQVARIKKVDPSQIGKKFKSFTRDVGSRRRIRGGGCRTKRRSGSERPDYGSWARDGGCGRPEVFGLRQRVSFRARRDAGIKRPGRHHYVSLNSQSKATSTMTIAMTARIIQSPIDSLS